MSTWWAATLSWGDLLHLVQRVDVVMLPYYLLMRIDVALLGDSATALRIPAALAMAGTSAVLVLLGRRMFGGWTGLVAGLLFAILPCVTRYGQEARGYALSMLACAVAALALARALESRNWTRWWWYSAAVAFIGFSHLLSLAVLAGYLLGVVVWLWRDADRWVLARRWVVATGVGLVPILPIAVIGLTERNQIHVELATWEIAVAAVALLFGGKLLGWTMVGASLAARWSDHRPLALIAGWACGAPAILFLISHVWPFFTARYILFCVPAWCLLVAVAVASGAGCLSRTGWWALGRAGMALVLLLSISIDDNRAVRGRLERQESDYAIPLSLITEQMLPGDAIAYGTQDWSYMLPIAVQYYVPEDKQPTEVFTEVSAEDSGWWIPQECADLLACLGDTQRLWLVRSTLTPADPLVGLDGSDTAKEELLGEMFTITEQRWSGLFGVMLLVRNPGM